MYAPPDAVVSLERLHPTARLGWHGFPTEPGGPLNNGQFALIQLYTQRDWDTNNQIYQRWTPGLGPIYGSPIPPGRVPVWLASFDKEEVQTGSFILKLYRWMRPMWERIVESKRAEAQQYDHQITEMAEEVNDHLVYNARNDTAGGAPIVAKKFLTKDEKAYLAGEKKPDVVKDMMRGLPKEALA